MPELAVLLAPPEGFGLPAVEDGAGLDEREALGAFQLLGGLVHHAGATGPEVTDAGGKGSGHLTIPNAGPARCPARRRGPPTPRT